MSRQGICLKASTAKILTYLRHFFGLGLSDWDELLKGRASGLRFQGVRVCTYDLRA